jgi:hypothetical protein
MQQLPVDPGPACPGDMDRGAANAIDGPHRLRLAIVKAKFVDEYYSHDTVSATASSRTYHRRPDADVPTQMKSSRCFSR